MRCRAGMTSLFPCIRAERGFSPHLPPAASHRRPREALLPRLAILVEDNLSMTGSDGCLDRLRRDDAQDLGGLYSGELASPSASGAGPRPAITTPAYSQNTNKLSVTIGRREGHANTARPAQTLGRRRALLLDPMPRSFHHRAPDACPASAYPPSSSAAPDGSIHSQQAPAVLTCTGRWPRYRPEHRGVPTWYRERNRRAPGFVPGDGIGLPTSTAA